jgi:hypothetical protein
VKSLAKAKGAKAARAKMVNLMILCIDFVGVRRAILETHLLYKSESC